MSEKKNKNTIFSSWVTLLSAMETNMVRMRILLILQLRETRYTQ